MDGAEARVTVSVRVRPTLSGALNALQQSERYEEVICVPTSDSRLRLAERRPNKPHRHLHFAYDHVFDHEATQEDVYEAAAVDGVDRVLGGTNASLLTYGQTGSGKTYTVLGKMSDSVEVGGVVGQDSGLLLRAIQDMLSFAERMRHKGERHVVLGITAIEIYNDEIRDLLREGVSVAPLQPIMTRDALHLPGLTHAPLHTLRDACAVYELAAARRVQRATSANDTSSRSHAIFTVEVFQSPLTHDGAAAPTLHDCCALRRANATATGWAARPAGKGASRCFEGAPNVLFTAEGLPIMCSALTVADLAGSEKAKHADVHGTGFDELRRINASLTALGNVVHHLHHGSTHIPYRDSKLTMMLRDTFTAPRSHVLLFVNVSPTAVTGEETLSSLYFADKVKGMTAPDVATSPQLAALQSGYLSALREHDALLADLHICQVQQEMPTGLLQRVASTRADHYHPFFQLPYHTALRDGPDKSLRLRQLCTQLRHEVSLEESAEARLHRVAETERRTLRKEFLKRYSQRRADVHAGIAAAAQAREGLSEELEAAQAAAQRTLAAVKADVQRLRETRQTLTVRLADVQGALAEAPFEGSGAEQKDETDSVESGEEVADTTAVDGTLAATHCAALEAAELRLLFVELVGFRVRTLPAPPTHDEGDASTPRDASRSRSGTSSSGRKATTVEAWVRSAVVAMAGNAVLQSTKRKAKFRQASSRLPLGDVTNVADTPTTAKAQQPPPPQHPKYWQLLQQDKKRKNGVSSPVQGCVRAESVAPVPDRRFPSSFDDPALLTRVTAYMDMGASLVKIDRTGRARERWFYVTQRQGRFVLCWDDARRGAGLRDGGHVYLDAVSKITLGRSSPGFLKHAEVTPVLTTGADTPAAAAAAAVEEEAACTSFTVVYHSRSNHRDLKFVDVVCPDRSEMETWVVGLAHWAGVSPLFEDSRQPDDTAAAADMAGSAKGDAHHGAGERMRAASEDQDAQEAVLCRLWHIPADVMVRTREEVSARRGRHRSGQMRLTPGQLRDLTGLDIFRASALWRHLAERGWVVNATSRLCCFVGGDRLPGERASEAAAAAAAAV